MIYHTLTSLIGKNNHKVFKDAAVKLGMLKQDYNPTKAWESHVISVTRNTPKGPAPGFKYSKEFVDSVLRANPILAKDTFKCAGEFKGFQSLSQYIGSSGHAPFKAFLEKLGAIDTNGDPTAKFTGHIKKQGYYYTYSLQLIVKVCLEYPEVLSMYPTLHQNINPIRKSLGLVEITLPEIVEQKEEQPMVDLELR